MMFLKTIDSIGKKFFGNLDKLEHEKIKKITQKEIDKMLLKAKENYENAILQIRKKTAQKLEELEKEPNSSLFKTIKMKFEKGKLDIERKKEENIILKSKNLLTRSLLLLKQAKILTKKMKELK